MLLREWGDDVGVNMFTHHSMDWRMSPNTRRDIVVAAWRRTRVQRNPYEIVRVLNCTYNAWEFLQYFSKVYRRYRYAFAGDCGVRGSRSAYAFPLRGKTHP